MMRGPAQLMITPFLRIKDKISTDPHLAELIKGSGTCFVLSGLRLGFGFVFPLIINRAKGRM